MQRLILFYDSWSHFLIGSDILEQTSSYFKIITIIETPRIKDDSVKMRKVALISYLILFYYFIIDVASTSDNVLILEPHDPETLENMLGLNHGNIVDEALKTVHESKAQQAHMDGTHHGNLRRLVDTKPPSGNAKLQRLMFNQTSGDGYYNVSAASSGLVLPYNGGPVIPNVQVVTIWWGSNVQYTSALEGFYNTVTKSSWQQIFAEYSTPSSTIGMGRWLQSYSYASAPTGTVWDSRIQSDLKTFLNNKLIPQPNQNTYYAIHFAPGITIKIGSDASCSDFCAYHSSFSYGSYKVAYGVMPDPGGSCAGSCGRDSKPFNNLCSVSSHELAEAITDPAWPVAWNHPNAGEIADICNHQHATMGSYVVQKQWSNKANACISSAQGPVPAPVQAPAPAPIPAPAPAPVTKPVQAPAPVSSPFRPTPQPVTSPVRPTPQPVTSTGSCVKLNVTLFTDNKGYETWFYVVDLTQSSSTYYDYVWISSQKLSSNTRYSSSQCFDPTHCYIVVMADKGNDGMCCSYGNGWYDVYWKGSRVKHSSFVGTTYEGTKVGKC